MKTGFENELTSIGPKKIKSPWDYTQPAYDERSSSFINAGSNQGVGKKVAVGIEGGPKKGYAVPMGKKMTLRSDDIPNYSLDSQ